MKNNIYQKDPKGRHLNRKSKDSKLNQRVPSPFQLIRFVWLVPSAKQHGHQQTKQLLGWTHQPGWMWGRIANEENRVDLNSELFITYTSPSRLGMDSGNISKVIYMLYSLYSFSCCEQLLISCSFLGPKGSTWRLAPLGGKGWRRFDALSFPACRNPPAKQHEQHQGNLKQQHII